MMPHPEDKLPLAGRRIAVLEHRELDRLGHMLEAQGAETLRCPLIAIVDSGESEAVGAWLRRFVETPPDDLVLMTGEGLRRLAGFAARIGIEPAFREALGRVRSLTRGPKPAQALRALGLNPGLRAAQPTTDGVIAALSQSELRGRRVAVQLYPDAPDTLTDFLATAGALADPVFPYAYVTAASDDTVLGLIADLGNGRVDAVAFTSTPQVTRLFAAAAEARLEEQLRESLGGTQIAAVGPVVAQALRQQGLHVAIMPRDSFFMKPLVTAIADALSR
ncbi:MAG TPA: uroporphyrinogen-III synthase [Stellaceae bacterium]|jgi:uroporphyrinogen-III synthase|nr:uroporphyrinogen-III synthase [Stellaceae bacterium]